MTPSNEQTNDVAKKTTQKTVFDLQKFDDVKLVKSYDVPSKPSTLEEALAAVGNDQSKLLEVIHEGLVAAANDAAYNDANGWNVEIDGETLPYSGQYADENKTKLINGAVLNLAKLQAGGSWDTLDKTKKASFKDSAIQMLRDNPAMLKSIAG